MTKTCIHCGKEHTRVKFCSDRCKDNYNNIVNPRGKYAFLKTVDKPIQSKRQLDETPSWEKSWWDL